MNQSYSKQLYGLYIEGRAFCDDENFKETVRFLIHDRDHLEDKYPGVAVVPRIYNNTRTLDGDAKFANTYAEVENFSHAWRTKVENILHQLPQASFSIRFDEAYDRDNKPDAGYIMLTGDMAKLSEMICKLKSQIDELNKIISDYDALPQSVGVFTTSQPQPALTQPEIIYKITYDEMSGKIFVNDAEVYKCNLDSKLDQALTRAFKTPNETIKISGSIASALKPIRMPEGLKRLSFRSGKCSFKVNPNITADDLAKVGLSQAKLDLELQNLSK